MPDLNQNLRIAAKTYAPGGEFYDRFIWAIAREITGSREEAEAAACEIVRDIERFAKHGDEPRSRDEHLESVIAWRRLVQLAGTPGH